MNESRLSETEKYLKKHKWGKIWRWLMVGAAAAVAFITVYILIFPGITMETDTTCGMAEHQHTAECYSQPELVCALEETEGHQHTEECYMEQKDLICGQAEDPEIHTHTEECYEITRILVCQKEEIPPHHHGEECYFPSEPILDCGMTEHQHTEECYVQVETEEENHFEDEIIPALLDEYLTGITGMNTEFDREQDYYHTELKLEYKIPLQKILDVKGTFLYDFPSGVSVPEEMLGHTYRDYDDNENLRLTYEYKWNQDKTCRMEILFDKDYIGRMGETAEAALQFPSILGSQYAKEDGSLEIPFNENLTLKITEYQIVYPEKNTETENEIENEIENETESEPSGIEASLPSNLPVIDSARAENGTWTSSTRYGTLRVSDAEGNPATIDVVDVSLYITETKVYYKTKDSDWMLAANEITNLPGDAEVKLMIDYQHVPLDSLIAADGKLVYTLPDFLRNHLIPGKIEGYYPGSSTKTEIGDLVAQNQSVVITFKKDWLNAEKEDNNTEIKGDFHLEAGFNLSHIGEENTNELVIGGVEINLDGTGDLIAKYGTVGIEKSVAEKVIETDSGDYLEYTLTVTAGPDGMPDVTVVDAFTQNVSHIEKYAGVTDTAADTKPDLSDGGPAEYSSVANAEKGKVYIGAASTAETPIPQPSGDGGSPGTLVWKIGDMEPNEVRTLTYRAKLKEEYTGLKNSGSVTNKADIYAKDIARDSATQNFSLTAKATLTKTDMNFIPNEDGIGGKITYTIWVKALESNTYTIDNVKIYDYFADNNSSEREIHPDVTILSNSFHLYEGGTSGQKGGENLTEITDASSYNPHGDNALNPNIDKDNKNFVYYVGNLAPGESRTLVYTVQVNKELFLSGNDNITLANRAKIYSDDTKEEGNEQFNAYWIKTNVERYVWSRKTAGNPIQEASTIQIPAEGSVYQIGADKKIISMDAVSEFTVPAGSFQYQVIINEKGKVNVNSATMTDTLGEHLAYSGYVRIDAYDRLDGSLSGNKIRTVWLNVDNLRSFSFAPSDFYFGANEDYAYQLTYYATPNNVGAYDILQVGNDFIMSGQIIGSNGQYLLQPVRVSASVTVTGSSRFSAQKYGWYYAHPSQDSEEDWGNGELYWYIQVKGTSIPEGTILQDTPGSSNHTIKDGSLVGIYKGKLPESAENIGVLEQLTPLSGEKVNDISGETADTSRDYIYAIDGSAKLNVRFTKEILIDEGNDESVYIIVKTSPGTIPANGTARETYTNNLKSKSNSGTEFVDEGSDTLTVFGSDGISKISKGAFDYDGENWKGVNTNQVHDETYLDTTLIHEPGTYLDWLVQVNWFGTMEGRAYIQDIIPEGTELVYVRLYAYATSYRRVDLTTPELEEYANNGEWTKCTAPNRKDETRETIYYYNASTGEIRWAVDGLHLAPNPENPQNSGTVEFQVVCRVTDESVLMGGEQKDFVNRVSGTDKNGVSIGNGAAGITIYKTTLTKKGVYNPETSGGRYPFSIKLNPLGEDLVKGSDTIVLVDELSDTLILDTNSIKVVHTNTEEEILNYTPSLENGVLSIILPDSLPLTVTYEAEINAAPGQNVNISNNAHWKGYTIPYGGSVSNENFSYTAGGTAGGAAQPNLKLTKVSQANTNLLLEGAEFAVQEVSVKNNTLGALTGDKHTGRTDSTGTVVFSGGTDEPAWMEFNKVYCLWETKAPEGYMLDSTPYYFAIAKAIDKDNSGKDIYQTFPEGVNVRYGVVTYEYTAYNRKGEIQVNKQFKNEDNESQPYVSGTYVFGIFDSEQTENSSSEPIQKLTITYAQDSTVTFLRDGVLASGPFFKNLPLTSQDGHKKKYYIYELDSDGKPIPADGSSVAIDGNIFKVSYTGNGVEPAQTVRGNVASVTITNQKVSMYELPETGGTGIYPYILWGLSLTGIAGLFLYIQNRRKKPPRTS